MNDRQHKKTFDLDTGDGLGDLPRYPDTCMVEGCDKDTAVVMVQCRVAGRVRVFQPSAVLDYNANQTRWTARPKRDVNFTGWITRCAFHYSEDQSRRDKSEAGQRIHAKIFGGAS